MGITNSPLRYPGGKTVLAPFLSQFIKVNKLHDGIYVEPYAGGAGAALNLLFGEYVQCIILNDADRSIYLLWKAIISHTEELINMIREVPICIDEWRKQKYVFKNQPLFTDIEIGFATLYLNRCNRSGIIKSGPIGGQNQAGKWKIDVRFKKDKLIRRIEKIALYNSRIKIYNLDAIEFLETVISPISKKNKNVLVYLDPPYFSKGNQLYLNYYSKDDHIKLSEYITEQNTYKWVISYDDAPEINNLYKAKKKSTFNLNYFVHSAKIGKEIIIYCPECIIPLGHQPQFGKR